MPKYKDPYIIVSFELKYCNIGSWNGKFSGSENKYYSFRKIKKSKVESFMKESRKSFHYNFGDGWSVNVIAEIVDSKENKNRMKISSGFNSYEWMIKSILDNGQILSDNIKV